MNYDPSDPNTLSNPYPYFSMLRRDDPIHWSMALKSWIITRYEDVKSILSSDNITVDRLNNFYSRLPSNEAKLLAEIVKYLNLWAAFRNPPDHTRMRKIMMVAFTRKSINEMQPKINAITEATLSKLKNMKEVD